MAEIEDDDFDSDEDLEFLRSDPRKAVGRSRVTGY